MSLAACGGEKSDQPDNGPSTPQGSQRIGWDQPASSAQQLRELTFWVFIDGISNALGDARCGTTARAVGYDCSATLPMMSAGRRVLELVSVWNGVTSARSAPLTITVGGSGQIDVVAVQEVSESSAAPGQTCSDTPGRCYEVRYLADGLSEVMLISALPDGRLMVAEAGARVWILGDPLAPRMSALKLPPEGSPRIVGMAVDPNFAQTRTVYLAYTQSFGDGRESLLHVTRYRELAGTLGEGATLISEIPIAEGANAPLAVDGQGLLYIAVPSPTSSKGRDPLLEEPGIVLRVTRDGQSPDSNPRASAIFAQGSNVPKAFAVDDVRRRLYLAGYDESERLSIGMLALDDVDATWPARPTPQGALRTPSSDKDARVAFAGHASTLSMLVVSEGRLLQVFPGARLEQRELRIPGVTRIVDAVSDGSGALYIVADHHGLHSILRLAPQLELASSQLTGR